MRNLTTLAVVAVLSLSFERVALADPDGVDCTADTDCDSGFCTDGVCCDRACDDECEACDASGSVGSCIPIVGEPHGERAACDALASDDCAKMQCDGTTTATCAGYVNGPATECSAASCAEGTATPAATCDGSGSCVASVPVSCGFYACTGDGTACGTSCASDTDCASDFTCSSSGDCIVAGPSCSPDGTSSISSEGVETSCAPYTCTTSGECLTECVRPSDCASGFVCNLTEDVCGVAGGTAAPTTTVTTSSGGGCAVDSRGSSSGGGWTALGALAVIAVGTRRRRGER